MQRMPAIGLLEFGFPSFTPPRFTTIPGAFFSGQRPDFSRPWGRHATVGPAKRRNSQMMHVPPGRQLCSLVTVSRVRNTRISPAPDPHTAPSECPRKPLVTRRPVLLVLFRRGGVVSDRREPGQLAGARAAARPGGAVGIDQIAHAAERRGQEFRLEWCGTDPKNELVERVRALLPAHHGSVGSVWSFDLCLCRCLKGTVLRWVPNASSTSPRCSRSR